MAIAYSASDLKQWAETGRDPHTRLGLLLYGQRFRLNTDGPILTYCGPHESGRCRMEDGTEIYLSLDRPVILV